MKSDRKFQPHNPSNLEAAGLQVVIFDGVKEDPPDTIINEAAEIALAAQIDGIVGVGGGSTMDTAKKICRRNNQQ